MLTRAIYRFFFIALFLLPAHNVQSKEISFDFIEATFTSSTINTSASPNKIEGNGIGFFLSLSINPHYAITLSVLSTSFDTFQSSPTDTIKTSNLGLTAHTKIADATEIYGNAGLFKVEITGSNAGTKTSDSEVNYELRAGLRHLINEALELEIGAAHFYAFDYPSNTLNTELRYYVRNQISVGLAYKTGSNQDSLSLNGRMNF